MLALDCLLVFSLDCLDGDVVLFDFLYHGAGSGYLSIELLLHSLPRISGGNVRRFSLHRERISRVRRACVSNGLLVALDSRMRTL